MAATTLDKLLEQAKQLKLSGGDFDKLLAALDPEGSAKKAADAALAAELAKRDADNAALLARIEQLEKSKKGKASAEKDPRTNKDHWEEASKLKAKFEKEAKDAGFSGLSAIHLLQEKWAPLRRFRNPDNLSEIYTYTGFGKVISWLQTDKKVDAKKMAKYEIDANGAWLRPTLHDKPDVRSNGSLAGADIVVPAAEAPATAKDDFYQ